MSIGVTEYHASVFNREAVLVVRTIEEQQLLSFRFFQKYYLFIFNNTFINI